ncbi:WG repeat-containing protein [Salmonirosea aquatica]|uniref:WG repeat-containing protein n=1 Tax=Salmonirosea aquatica TaxID=2654236 RepID=A0A7C9F6G1_9BACT|nr:hypothetical protein [Cytophagaceae bacterium SJW1-29]
MKNRTDKNKIFKRQSYNFLIPSVKYFKNRTTKWGFCDENKNVIIEHIYDAVSVFYDGLSKVYKDHKIGFVDLFGNEVIPCKYNYIEDFKDNITSAKSGRDQITIEKTDNEILFYHLNGALDKTSTKLKSNLNSSIGNTIALEFDEFREFSDNLAAVKNGERWGFINREGKIEIPFIYDKVSNFSESLCSVMKKINDNLIFENTGYPNDSESINSDHLDGYFAFLEEKDLRRNYWRDEMNRKHTEKWGVIDKDNNIVIPFEFEEIRDFINEKAIVSSGGSFGVINKLGELVIPCHYSYINICKENDYYFVARGTVDTEKNNWGYIDNTGVEILSCDYNYEICIFHEHLARIYIDGKGWGFINKHGEVIIDCRYDDAQSFSQGLAAVSIKGKWGFINQLDQPIIPFIYDRAFWFTNGTSVVERNKKMGAINLDGEIVIPLEYDDVGNFSEGLCSIAKDGKMGFLNEKGDIQIPIKYDHKFSQKFENNLLEVECGNRKFYIDRSGTEYLFEE